MQGLLLIDKPKGITSFNAVAVIRRIYGEKRVGHTGTLDPMATGVLPIFVGRPTVLSQYLLKADKEYFAKVRLGITTDTLDITGNVLKTSDVNVTFDMLNNVAKEFVGNIEQIPPMYSAIKQDGKKLCDLARNGKEVARKSRTVNIKKLEISDFDGTEFCMKVLCSKGTYIRTLADDIGKKLNTGAAICELRRTATAGFTIDECTPLDLINENNACSILKNEECAVLNYPAIYITEKQAFRFTNGGALSLERLKISDDFISGQIFRVKFEDKFLGLGKIDTCNELLSVETLVNFMRNE